MRWKLILQFGKNEGKNKLDKETKFRIRIELIKFVGQHPINVEVLNRAKRTSALNYLMLKPMPVAIVLASLLSTGTVATAQDAVPGEVLYPVKTEIERAESVLRVSDKSQAIFCTKRMERRLHEMKQLVDQKRLTQAKYDQLARLYQQHKLRAENLQKKLENEQVKKQFMERFENAKQQHAEYVEKNGLQLCCHKQ